MTDERIIAYLLEELRPEEAEQFEEACFAEEAWPAQLRLVEDELIDDYLCDNLPPEQRRRFVNHYLTTAARRQRVRVAAALLRHASVEIPAEVVEEPADEPARDESPPRPAPRSWLRALWGDYAWAPRAAVALVLVAFFAAGVWWLTRTPAPRSFVALTISATRGDRATGARPAAVKLPRGADALDLTLLLPEGEESAALYRAELEDAGGTVTPLEAAAGEARKVSVGIPAARLERGSYALRLYAVGGDGGARRVPGSYLFNVE